MAGRKNKPKKKSPAGRKISLAALALFAAAAVAAGLFYLHYFSRPSAGEPVTVIIDPGTALPVIARTLRESGVVVSAEGFMMAAKVMGLAGRIRAGEFAVPRGLSPMEVVSRLAFGPVVQRKITIPEGFTVRQIAELMTEKNIGAPAANRTLAHSSDFARGLGIPAGNLEGYLFPDTYQYTRGYGPKELLERMAQRFFGVYDQRMRRRQEELGLTMHQAITLASIVEKETAVPAERPRIAAVFFNRLKKGMPLQSDPTVIYGLGEKYRGNLTRADLIARTRYNTYVIRGLPPGPIASPGKAALEAVLWPGRTDELYFVSRGDGTHEFNSDYGKHIAAVNRYQRGGRPAVSP